MRRKYEFGIGAGRRPKREPDAYILDPTEATNKWHQPTANGTSLTQSITVPNKAEAPATTTLRQPEPVQTNANIPMQMEVDVKEEFCRTENFPVKLNQDESSMFHQPAGGVLQPVGQHSNVPNILRRARCSDVSNGVSLFGVQIKLC